MKVNILSFAMLGAAVAACGGGAPEAGVDQQELLGPPCDYPQAFATSKHTGLACPGVKGMHVAQVIVQDPDAAAENAFSGFLQIHESAPLTKGNMVVVPSKSGFTDGLNRTTEHYSLQAFRWSPGVNSPNAKLLPAWKADTTWKPIDALFGSNGFGKWTNGYVQGFFPAIANASVYQPATAGTLQRVNLATGALFSTIDPFKGTAFEADPFVQVVNALSVDAKGNVYYAAVAFPTSGARDDQPRGSWVVVVHPDDTSELIDWPALVQAAGLPGLDDIQCEYPFGTSGTPAPTGPTSQAPLFGCGLQRPAMNAAIAVDDNGDMVVLTAANNSQATFLVKVSGATHRALWTADTRKGLTYGCGVRADATTFDNCPVLTNNGTTNLGVDPQYNLPIHWTSTDIMDNSPTIAPNGDVSIGSYDTGFSFEGVGGFDARGSALLFNSAGQQVGKNEAYGWEVTPAVIPHADGSFSYTGDRNLYSLFDLTVAVYDSRFNGQGAGSIPLDQTKPAIDWLDAGVLVDTDGSYYGVSGQGLAIKFDATGKQVDQVVLPNADGTGQLSMETLAGYSARDELGRLYFSYAGNVYVVDGTGVLNPQPTPKLVGPGLAAGLRAKVAGLKRDLAPPAPRAPLTDLVSTSPITVDATVTPDACEDQMCFESADERCCRCGLNGQLVCVHKPPIQTP